MSNNPITETLINAKLLIYDEMNWTTGATARNKYGYRVSPMDPTAAKFCLEGAICRAAEIDYLGAAGMFARQYVEQTRGTCPWRINDAPSTKHEDVLNLLDVLIEASKTSIR